MQKKITSFYSTLIVMIFSKDKMYLIVTFPLLDNSSKNLKKFFNSSNIFEYHEIF